MPSSSWDLKTPRTAPPRRCRGPPLALYLHTLVILWFTEHGYFDFHAYYLAHPWYLQKRTPSFADMLACLKAACAEDSISRYPGHKPLTMKRLRPLSQALATAA